MPRQQSLKVYRTPIGFHDAYVAAPSQKAALAAWGSDADLFARGIAEVVTDEELTREPLASPGKVIKRSRGSLDEQLSALPPDRPAAKASASRPAEPEGPVTARRSRSAKPKPAPPPPKPRPSRAALDQAERRLAELLTRQRAEDQALRDRERALELERRELGRVQVRDRGDAEGAVEAERKAHAKALERWSADP